MRVRKELIPFVCLLIISGVLSSGIGETDGEISVNSSSPVPRHIRDAIGDKMSVAVDRMQKVARLATGISVQLGLISGSIQPDPLISELLCLGNVTVSDILALNAEKLTESMKQIRELPNTLVASEGIEQIEAKLHKIEQVRKLVKKAGDVKIWVGKQAFLQDVEFVTKNMDKAAIERAIRQISKWIDSMEGLSDLKRTESNDLTAAKDDIGEINKNTGLVEKAIATLEKTDESKWKYPNMKSAEESLEQLKSLSEAVGKSYKNFAPTAKGIMNEEEVFNSSKKNIEVLSKLSSSLDKVVPDLKRVEAVVRSRGSSQRKALEYPGFINGFRDIDSLFDDLSDDWMAQLIRADSMAVSLKPLKSLFHFLKQVNNAFGSYENEKTIIFSKYLEHVKDIQTVRADSSAIIKAVDGFWKCKKLFDGIDEPSDTNFTQFIGMAKELDGNMKTLQDNVAVFKDIVNAEGVAKLFGEVKKLCATAAENAKDMSVIDTVERSKAVIDLEKVLRDAKNALTTAKNAANMTKSLADGIAKNSGSVDTYIKSLQKYHPLFKCLNELDEGKSKLVMEGMKTSQKFRNVENDSEVVTDGEEVVNEVVDSVERFKKLKVAIEGMKHENVKDLDALKALSDPVKQSKVIGAAVRGVTAMKEALRKKVHADAIILNSGVVETQMKQAKLEQADVNNLKSVVQMKGSLTTMYQKLDVWRKGVSEVSSKGLANSFSMFSTAKSVPGVTGDLGAMAKSVDLLIKSVTDNTAAKKLVSVKKALETLDTSGLDFASYSTQFDASRDSLTALDVFCANYTTRVSPALNYSDICLQMKSKPVLPKKWCPCDPCKEKKPGLFEQCLFLFPIIIAVAVCIMFTLWYKRIFRRKLENAKRKEEKGNENTIENTKKELST